MPQPIAPFPSFSIILETENLANADLNGLVNSLASLVHQTLSPTDANEVMVIDSGDAPPELLQQLCDRNAPILRLTEAAANPRDARKSSNSCTSL